MTINANVAISETGFIFDPTSGNSYTLNPVALDFINLVKANKSLKEVKTTMTKKYDVDDSMLEKDYYDFVNMLKQYQLVTE